MESSKPWVLASKGGKGATALAGLALIENTPRTSRLSSRSSRRRGSSADLVLCRRFRLLPPALVPLQAWRQRWPTTVPLAATLTRSAKPTSVQRCKQQREQMTLSA